MVKLRTLQMMGANYHRVGNHLLTLFPRPRGANARRGVRELSQLTAQDKIVEFITQNIDFFWSLETLSPGTPLPEADFLLNGNLNR